MFSAETITFSNVLIGLYLLLVFFVGVFSLIALAVLFRHAEKRSVAMGVIVTYCAIFAVIVLTSIGAMLRL